MQVISRPQFTNKFTARCAFVEMKFKNTTFCTLVSANQSQIYGVVGRFEVNEELVHSDLVLSALPEDVA